ncbi:hypothetical protein EJ110_NYTH40585 [Nymphaea thermarum]|nr:hypothetical protein EJ110_NYTH40585 [Nymphaea thermarum]
MDRFVRRPRQHSQWDDSRDLTCARLFLPFTIWICVCLSLRYGYYGSSQLVLGPNSSRLLKASSVFVKQLQVKDDAERGLMLFGFTEKPELSYEANWTVSKSLFIPAYHRQGFSVWLNQGSSIRARWNVPAPAPAISEPLVVLLRGEKNYRRWLRDPKKALVVDSRRLTNGRGEVNYTVEEDDNYYIGAVNVNSRTVKATMTVDISSMVYNTSKAETQCSTKNGLCSLKILFPKTRYAVITTPKDMTDDTSAWYVELSYAARVVTYILVLGLFVVLIYLFLKYFGAIESDRIVNVQETRDQRETSPLVDPKQTAVTLYGATDEDDDSQVGSSSEDLYDGKICVICYEEPRNCFFVPCGHCATCYSCAQRIEGVDFKPCPICRRQIHKVRRLISS